MWQNLPDDQQDVVKQCAPMGHAGEKVICKSVGSIGVQRLADLNLANWQVDAATDCTNEEGADEEDLHEFVQEECPAIEMPGEMLELASCEDEAHSHLPPQESALHITCVQACLFELKRKCDSSGWLTQESLLQAGGPVGNQSDIIKAGVLQMMFHCGIEIPHAHDAYVWAPGAFLVFYAIVLAFFGQVYKTLLRSGPERAFTLAKAKGEIKHHEQAQLRRRAIYEKYVPQLNMFFMANLDDPSNVKELGMDAAMYLAHLRLCGKYCVVLYLTLGIVLTVTYMLAHSEMEWTHSGSQWLVMSSYSYTELTTTAEMSEYLWIIPFGALMQSFGMIYFVALRQKKMNKVKLASGFHEVRSTTTLWFEDVPPDLDDRVIERWFQKAVPGKVQDVHVAKDVHHLGKNIREQRKLINRINTLNLDVAANRAGEEGTAKVSIYVIK